MEEKNKTEIDYQNCPEGFFFAIFGNTFLMKTEDIKRIVDNYKQLCEDDETFVSGKEKLYLANGNVLGQRLFKGPSQAEFTRVFLQPALFANRDKWQPYNPDPKAIEEYHKKKAEAKTLTKKGKNPKPNNSEAKTLKIVK